MKLNHVVIIYKKPSHVCGAGARQKSHLAAIEYVQKALKELGINYKIILRDKLESSPKSPLPPFGKGGATRMPPFGKGGCGGIFADLIITIGGDGTVLSASHFAGNVPILGVNSMPKTSVGFFCAAKAKNFKKIISDIKRGVYKPSLLPLLEVSLDGRRLPFRALNDILFASTSPAETVQYVIQVGERKERQRGSGVWIAAGPGSTAGICSAGGKATAIKSGKIQYLAREPYPIPGVRYRLKRGFVKKGGSVKIISEMKRGIAFLDGAKLAYPMPRGSRLSVRISPHKLKIFL